MIRTALALMLSATPALATQEYILPTLFDVTRVAPDDVLNIRADPNGSAPIIGTLAPEATRVEVVEERRGWGRVNTGEGSGWVSMQFMHYRTDVWEENALPAGWQCFGTEPFWTVIPQGDQLVTAMPGLPDDMRPLRAVLSTGVFRDPTRAVTAPGMTLTTTPQICSDGMSDRLFGLQALVVIDGDSHTLLRGCCSIHP
ncbi:SH3 domain-containing protein [Paracoccus sediminilitoris]|uniref:SH3 domain-containing protein n=1 Tax=Paracoccus sediminilitoris TaxID=2202419 RepID=UPI000DB9E62C|nr:SH3 domain-containing protein [Paracoccus sediminilitoris]